MMKKVFLFLLAGSMIMTSCKKEGCTDSTATNYNPDAKKDDGSCIAKVVEVPTDTQKPTGTMKSKETSYPASTTVVLNIDLKDDKGLKGYALTTSPNIGTKTGVISGTTHTEAIEIPTTETTAVKDYTATLKITDAFGNTETVTATFKITEAPDTEKPKVVGVAVKGPRTDGKLETGSTPNKVEFHVTDNKDLSEISIICHNADLQVGQDKDIWKKTIDDTALKGKKEYKEVIDVTLSGNATTGQDDDIVWKITVKDVAGNTTSSEVAGTIKF